MVRLLRKKSEGVVNKKNLKLNVYIFWINLD